LRQAAADGQLYLVLDGTLIPIDRLAADRTFYSGEHRKQGMNLQVIATPGGDIVWVSGALPGSAHDLTAARIWGILRALEALGLLVLANKGYNGAGEPLFTPKKGRNKPKHLKDPIALTLGFVAPVDAQTRSSRTGGSSANCAAARTAPGSWPKPSMYYRADEAHTC
jgi:hypothetical protein